MSLDDALSEAFEANNAKLIAALLPQLADLLADRPQRLAYTTAEAAQAMGTSERTIYTWVEQGRLPRLPGYRKVLIGRLALEAFARGDDPHRLPLHLAS